MEGLLSTGPHRLVNSHYPLISLALPEVMYIIQVQLSKIISLLCGFNKIHQRALWLQGAHSGILYTSYNKYAAQAAAQTLPDATPPVGKIHPFRKIAVTFEPIQQFRCSSRSQISEKMSI